MSNNKYCCETMEEKPTKIFCYDVEEIFNKLVAKMEEVDKDCSDDIKKRDFNKLRVDGGKFSGLVDAALIVSQYL